MVYDLYLNESEYVEFVKEYNAYLDSDYGKNETDYQITETFFSDADTMPKAA